MPHLAWPRTAVSRAVVTGALALLGVRIAWAIIDALSVRIFDWSLPQILPVVAWILLDTPPPVLWGLVLISVALHVLERRRADKEYDCLAADYNGLADEYDQLVQENDELSDANDDLVEDLTNASQRAAESFAAAERLKAALDNMQEILNLRASLLILLEQLAASEDRKRGMSKLLGEYLLDAMRAVGSDVRRATILVPNQKGDYLVPWVNFAMPSTSLRKDRFYIGDRPDRKRGVAGVVFRSRQLLVVHVDHDHGIPVADHSEYIDGKGGPNRAPLQYRSFAAVPLERSPEDACLGVLCLDSGDRAAFDQPIVQDMLLEIGALIGTALVVYDRLSQPEASEWRPELAGDIPQ